MTGDRDALLALAATVAACLAVVLWLVRHTPRQAAEWEARLPELSAEERAAAEEVARGRAGEARARGESPDEAALVARAVREARLAKFRAANRPY